MTYTHRHTAGSWYFTRVRAPHVFSSAIQRFTFIFFLVRFILSLSLSLSLSLFLFLSL